MSWTSLPPFLFLTWQKCGAISSHLEYVSPLPLIWTNVSKLEPSPLFPGCSVVQNPTANAGDMDSIPESGRSPGWGNDNPLQYSCLKNSVERGAWQAIVLGVVKESGMTEHACVHVFNVPSCLHGLITQFPLTLNNIPLPGCTTVYLPIYLTKNILVASNFWQLWLNCCKPLCADFCVDRVFNCFG